MSLRRSLGAVVAGMLLAVGGLAATASNAVAAPVPSVPGLVASISTTYPANPPAWYGRQHTYDADSARMLAPLLTQNGIRVGFVSKNQADEPVGFSFRPVSGQTLHTGYYPHASSAGDADSVPEILLSHGSLVETPTDADVQITDLALDDQGGITRFDLVFRISPSTAIQSIFGEIRLNEPSLPAATISSTHAWFPLTVANGFGITVNERVRNTSPVPQTVGQLAFSGGTAGDFTLQHDHCSGRLLSPGSSCTADVVFRPTGSGSRASTMAVPVAGATQLVTLEGEVATGRTRVLISGDDYVDGGARHNLIDGKTQMTIYPTSLDWLEVRVSSLDIATSPNVFILIKSPLGVPLAPGTYHTDPAPVQNAWHFTAAGYGRGCNDWAGEITIKQIQYDTDHLVSADITFTESCIEDPSHPMRGEIEWRHTA